MTSILERHRERLAANPADQRAFQALEEHHFLAGDWDALIALYEQRLGAPDLPDVSPARAALLLREAQVWAERKEDPGRATACYERALRADPSSPAPLRQLRRIHLARERWDLALQIAEAEAEHPALAPPERAEALAQMGLLWLERLDDPETAATQFERALAEDPTESGALTGLPRALHRCSRDREAAEAWERALPHLRGAQRVAGLIAQAEILGGSLGRAEQAVQRLRQALTEDPQNREALEALAIRARAAGLWSLLADLQERRYEHADDARQQAEIAFEAGRIQLEHLNDLDRARRWLSRAVDLDPENPGAYRALADLQRASGEDEALMRSLERVIELSGDAPPVWALLEVASLHSDRRDDLRALENLNQAFDLAPDDALVGEALSETFGRLERHDELAEILDRRADAAPDDETRAGLLAELGSLYENRLGDPAAAIGALQRAFDACPTAPGVAAALLRLHRKSEAWDALRAFLERATREGPEAERVGFLCALGDLLGHRFRDPAAAAHALNEALDLDPGAPAAHRGLQRLAQAYGDADAQRAAWEREASVTTDPSRFAFLAAQLMRALEADENPEAALAWAKRWMEQAPDDTEPMRECARLHDRLGQTEALVEVLERLDALVERPEQSAIRRRLGALHVAAGRREAAIRAYQAALEADPADVDALETLVVQLDVENRLEDLVDARRRLAELLPPPRNAYCLDALAHLLLERLGDAPGAIEVLTRLSGIEGAPEDVDERLDALLDRSGDHERLAERLHHRLEASPPASPEAIECALGLGRVLLDHLGRFDEAAEAFRRAREWDPASAVATESLERTLRASGDAVGLADFYAEEAARAEDPGVADRMRFERATLIQDVPGGEAEALETYRRLAAEASDAPLRGQASERLLLLLERRGAWAELRDHLEAALPDAAGDEIVALHERLGALSRDRLRDLDAAATHYEAIARLQPERPESWRALARIYEQLERDDDLARVLEGELATGPDAETELVLRARVAALCAGVLADPDRARGHYNRVIQLDAGHVAAADFLLPCWEREGRHVAVVTLLEMRLATLEGVGAEAGEEGDTEIAARRAVLRTRIAAVRADKLDDLDGAIEALESALGEIGPRAFVAEPLAALYRRAGRRAEHLELCQQAAAAATEPSERADWWVRLGAARREAGADREAVEAYRRAHADRPDDREAQAALRDLYRKLDEPEPLAELLEAELGYLAGSEQVPARLELAGLLADRLGRPAEALEHLRQLLDVQPGHTDALDRALALAEVLGDEDAILAMLDASLSCWQPPAARAGLLARRSSLLAHVQGRAEEAVAGFREALSLDPRRPALRAELIAVLETEGRWREALDCLYEEALGADDATRAAVFERAAGIASERISPDAALPWLERLRDLRPDDGSVLERMARIHRGAGRAAPLLRVLDAELALGGESTRELEIHLERARILEERLDCTPLAVAELEAARGIHPTDVTLLRELDRLYGELGRARERASVLEALVDLVTGEERLSVLCEIATLQTGPLGDPAGAARPLLMALSETADGPLRAELLGSLGNALRVGGPWDAWARCAEQELRCRTGAGSARRRIELHRELARVYERELGRPRDALPHLRILVDAKPGAGDPDEAERFEAAEATLLRLLEAQGSWIEWEERLSARVERVPDDTESWLSLARLRDEKLRDPASAMAAYGWLVELVPNARPVLRGLRSAATRVGDWVEVARSLELEIETVQASGRPPAERAVLWRSLGRVRWQRLGSAPEASQAFAAAIEADPRDVDSMRNLESLYEEMGDWPRALALYETEAASLDASASERLRDVWLRVAQLARTRTGELERALHAYVEAEGLAPLAADDQREKADLHRRLGQREAFTRAFARWCDDPAAAASCEDHLDLAAVLEALDRLDEAADRVDRALEVDPGSVRAWDRAAGLREARGDVEGASAALMRAAELLGDAEAAARLLRAGELWEDRDPGRALALLRAAAERDPADGPVQATLARVALASGNFEQAESAAGRALDLASAAGRDDPDARVGLALIGGRAAASRGHHAEAVRFFAAALAARPGHPEAMAEHGATLAELGDLEGARRVLEPRLALGDPYPERARHLVIVARALRGAGEPDAALERLEAALREDPRLDAAHEQLIGLLEAAGRTDEGIASLERWARVAARPSDRALRLLWAATWELREDERGEAAERHLREALEADPGCARASALLAEHLAAQERLDEALDVATGAVETAADPELRVRLSQVRGRALEARGALREAADAFADAASRSCEAALASARLLRRLGAWEEAAQVLRRFTTDHRGGALAGLADALEELGRLLAGPLEDLDAALGVFRRALALDPSRSQTRAVLADLLVHRPDDWSEAIAHHRALLEDDPTSARSLRAVVQIAQGRNNGAAAADGLALQRALGIVSPHALDEAPARISLRLAPEVRMADPLSEKLRQMAQEAAGELAEGLGGSSTPAFDGSEEADPTTAFRSTALAAEARLTAPALLPLGDAEVGEVLTLLAALVVDPEQVRGDGQLVNGLASALGRRARRRLRRILDGTRLEDVRDVDFLRWRREVRALATTLALDELGGDLRAALVALLCADSDRSPRDLPPGTDLTPLIASCPSADALLRHALRLWLDSV